jgi:prophage maintenance system killer protein
LIRPDVALALALNEAVRDDDEWFDEPDDLDRLKVALDTIETIDDSVEAAAVLAFRITRAQAFGEGNKRTALLLARWLLDRNGQDGATILPADDREVASLLLRAASGVDVQAELSALSGVGREDNSDRSHQLRSWQDCLTSQDGTAVRHHETPHLRRCSKRKRLTASLAAPLTSRDKYSSSECSGDSESRSSW